MNNINKLLKGYKRFYKKHFVTNTELYRNLHTYGQMPKTLFIACSDSRVDPSILMDAKPGDIFVIRNVANLVPPYMPNKASYHGTSAAIEFAVNILKIHNIIILGHSSCAGIKTLVDHDTDKDTNTEFSFINSWTHIAKKAKENALKAHCDQANAYQMCEQEGIKVSIDNLLSFPWVKSKVDNDEIVITGWYFCISTGKIFELNQNDTFEEILIDHIK